MLRRRTTVRRANIFTVDVESGRVGVDRAVQRGLVFAALVVLASCALWRVSLSLFVGVAAEEGAGREHAEAECCEEALRNVYSFIGNTDGGDLFYVRDKPCLCREPLDQRVASQFYQKLQELHSQSQCVVALELGISYCVASFSPSATAVSTTAVDPVVNEVGSSFYDVTEEYTTVSDAGEPTTVSVHTRRPNSAVVSYVSEDGQPVRRRRVFGSECQCLLFLQESCANATRY
ncbi:MAG: hypothetical protein CMI16_07210 [Opitutaceae bacterium]|nr:hypothetical protein [Opitutaceae bacterium]